MDGPYIYQYYQTITFQSRRLSWYLQALKIILPQMATPSPYFNNIPAYLFISYVTSLTTALSVFTLEVFTEVKNVKTVWQCHTLHMNHSTQWCSNIQPEEPDGRKIVQQLQTDPLKMHETLIWLSLIPPGNCIDYVHSATINQFIPILVLLFWSYILFRFQYLTFYSPIANDQSSEGSFRLFSLLYNQLRPCLQTEEEGYSV